MALLVGANTVTGRLGLGSWAPKPVSDRALDRKNRSGWDASTPEAHSMSHASAIVSSQHAQQCNNAQVGNVSCLQISELMQGCCMAGTGRTTTGVQDWDCGRLCLHIPAHVAVQFPFAEELDCNEVEP